MPMRRFRGVSGSSLRRVSAARCMAMAAPTACAALEKAAMVPSDVCLTRFPPWLSTWASTIRLSNRVMRAAWASPRRAVMPSRSSTAVNISVTRESSTVSRAVPLQSARASDRLSELSESPSMCPVMASRPAVYISM